MLTDCLGFEPASRTLNDLQHRHVWSTQPPTILALKVKHPRNAPVGQFEAVVEGKRQKGKVDQLRLGTLGGRPPTENNTKIVYGNVESVPPPLF